ncbi:MAG: hypothetical protein EPO21_05015 [Chloroflexota bacterium]|nr:MAG: hypothetical protein EPO21_05015 [Chloroflexota bacterium]
MCGSSSLNLDHALALTSEVQVAFFSMIVSYSPVGMAFVDQCGVVRAANESFARIRRIPLDRIVGCLAEAMFPGWVDELGRISRFTDKGSGPFSTEAHLISLEGQSPKGGMAWNAAVSALSDAQGNLIGYLVVPRSSAEHQGIQATQTRREGPRKRRDERGVEPSEAGFLDPTPFEKAERLTEEFVEESMCHDIRNSLTSIMGQAQLMCRQLRKKGLEREAQSAEAIVASARRINALIEDLAESSRLNVATSICRL